MTFHDIYKDIYTEQWKQPPQSISGWHCFVHRPVTKKLIIPSQVDQGKMSQPVTLLTNKNKKHFAKKMRASFGHPSQGVLRCSCQHSANASASAFDPKQPSLVLPHCFRGCGCGPKVLKHQQNCTGRDWKSALPTATGQSLRWVDYQKNIRIKKKQIWSSNKINGSLLVEKLTKYIYIFFFLIVHSI